MSVKLYDYKIRTTGESSLTAMKVAFATIIRGLWNTNHSTLRHDATAVRQELAEAKDLNADLLQRARSVIERFNALDPEELNRPLLDDKNLQMMNGTRATPAPKPKRAAPMPEEAPEPKAKAKPGPSEQRHHNAEDRLGDLENTMGVTRNPEGVLMMVPGGALHTLKETTDRLGVTKTEDGNTIFIWPDEVDEQLAQTRSIANEALSIARSNKVKMEKVSQIEQPVDWRKSVFMAAILAAIFYIVTGIIWGWSAMVIPTLGFWLALTLVFALLFPRLSNSNEDDNNSYNQPRG